MITLYEFDARDEFVGFVVVDRYDSTFGLITLEEYNHDFLDDPIYEPLSLSVIGDGEIFGDDVAPYTAEWTGDENNEYADAG